MRLFSIVQWYHFAYMAISIALLGFAASGTLLALIQSRRIGPLDEQNFTFLLSLISYLLFILTMASFYLAQKIPFSPFQLVWQKMQYLYLAGYYALFFVPFFLAGCFIGLNFMYYKERIARVYFYNLLGSGLGVLIAFVSFYLIHPAQLLIVSSLFAFLGFLFSAKKRVRSSPYLIVSIVGVLFLLMCLIKGGIPLEISPYKGISKGLQLPGARVEYEEYSPLGLLQVVDAPSLRYAPGLSLKYGHGPPSQKEIFVDGNSYGAVTNFKGKRGNLGYLDYSTFSLAYHLIAPKRVLVFNPGGGSQTLAALYHSPAEIQVVESHPGIVDILRGPLKSFSQRIYDHHPHIEVDIASPREFMARDLSTYDIIQLGLIGSWGGVGGGIYATGENHIYTIEAFREYFAHLKPGGILSASTWLSSPARTFVKLLALAVETLDEKAGGDISYSLVAIRSWATGTVLMKKGEFSLADLVKIRDFCRQRAFDLVYYPGIDQGEVNRYNILDRPVYYETIYNLLRTDKRDEYYGNYLFNIRPPTDDRPYFFHFFQLSALFYLLKGLGREWIPFLEWGYVILWATLVQAIIIAPLFIWLPLVFIRGEERLSSLAKGKVFVYFSLLGLAFMFIEMGYIQKFILLLTHPIFALALVLFTLMFFSGIGSLLSSRVGQWGKWIPFIGILFFSLIYGIFLDGLVKVLLPYPLFLRCILVVVLLAPLAFFMGMPFPIGLQLVSDRQSSYIPWVWGVNGVASVIAPVLGSLLSVSLGFRVLMLVSLLLYSLAGWVIHLIAQGQDN
ncbi:MAG: SAM-dependent methyltransferase [Deltaproteobacteria bacterium]|nr:MAG: SAM-dependent methyltransferase [Deltaproteobacteria bacterium]